MIGPKRFSFKQLEVSAVALACVALLALGAQLGCGSTEKQVVIGINQFMQHPLLDQVAKGVIDELGTAGISSDSNPRRYNLKNANGEMPAAVQINKQFVDEKVAVIVALGTPSAQSAVKATHTIPVVFGAITDPIRAGIADTIAKPGGNKTGTSDRWPFEKQVGLIRQILPNAKKVGIVLNPAESNTEATMAYVRPALQAAGLQAVEVPVASTTEVYGAAKSLVGRCDVFLVPGDNTVIAAFDSLVKVARQSKIPILGGTEDLIKAGSIATYAGDYYQIGRQTGKIVLQVLRGGVEPGSISVAIADQNTLLINEAAAKAYNVSIPPELLAVAKRQ